MRVKRIACSIIRRILLFRYGKRLELGRRPSPRLLWGLRLGKGCHVKIGDDVVIKPGARICVVEGGALSIGNNLFMNSGSSITVLGETAIGDRVLFGPNAMVFDHDHDYSSAKPAVTYKLGHVSIGDDVWLCAGSIVTRDTSVGDRSIVAANAVVYSNLPQNSVAAGVPAVAKKQILEWS